MTRPPLRCDKGHPLCKATSATLSWWEALNPLENWECDVCERDIPRSADRWRCTACDYDACDTCYAAPVKSGSADATSCEGLGTAEIAGPADASVAAAPDLLREARLDDSELCAEPFKDFGALTVVAPPWSPHHLLYPRMFALVLRNPEDIARGIMLMQHTDQSIVVEAATGILAELGPSADDLTDPGLYSALLSDPRLLAAVAGEGEFGARGREPHIREASSAEHGPPPVVVAPRSVAEEEEEEQSECPICFEPIQPSDAAMRCCGGGGIHHYFHATCLRQWIQAARNGQGATCPLCRCQLQLNGERLEEFLRSSNSLDLASDDRSFLESLTQELRDKGGQWCTVENAAHVGGLAACAGWGFMLGYGAEATSGVGTALVGAAVTSQLSQEHQIAQGVGWLAGLLARTLQELAASRRDGRDVM